ncbi:putative permease [Planctomycetes bacterium Pla163]|uniref:Putative permease n=1 Tax=Rohdeia mirabilis TaxID=2528008 RepID=A0A518CWU0_9BACT|nr:putative permease [Planctomycetes bacterium Pla163]
MLINDAYFSAALVALAALVGGLLPWTRRWSSEGMHRLVALSAGIFLGTVLHMGADLFASHGSSAPVATGAHANHGALFGLGAADGAGDGAGDGVNTTDATDDADTAPEAATPESADDGPANPARVDGPTAGADRRRGTASPLVLWLAVVGGFVGLAALERLVLRRWIGGTHGHGHGDSAAGAERPNDGGDADSGTGAASHEGDGGRSRHAVLWRASFVGLGIHALFGGMSLAGLLGSDLWAGALLFMLLHKLVESFSFSTVLRLANLKLGKAVLWIALFSCITPASFLLGRTFMTVAGPWQPLAVALACGTFLYVTVVDLLPEAFHRGSWKDRLPYLVFGLALGGFLPGLTHGHGGSVWGAGSGVFVEMAPYLMAGFLAAGFVSQLLDANKLKRFIDKDDVHSVAVASIAGAPLPLCSCSVLPVAASLRNAGASRGATSAFLVATPETGIDSVATTYALLGPIMAVVRPLSAVFSAIVTGLSVAYFGAPSKAGEVVDELATKVDAGSCCHGEPEPEPEPEPITEVETSCCHAATSDAVDTDSDASGTSASAATPAPPRSNLVARALRYAYVDLVDDLAWPLVIGVAASGVLGAFLPSEWLTGPQLQGIWGYLAMLAIGLPLYVCAAASTPIAAVLIAKGLSPGAVLVFLLASPATNIGTLFVVKRLLGGRGLAVHLLILSAVTLFCGVAVDLMLNIFGLDVIPSAASQGHDHGAGTISMVAAALLLLVLMASAIRKLGSPLTVPSSVTRAAA